MAGHIVIANRTSIGAQAGVLNSVTKEGQQLLGTPAFDVKEYFKAYVVFKKLPDLNQRLRELQGKVLHFERKVGSGSIKSM
jgi:UDP-3-O-[3-hydroxymyristoyl] glucosamine N-acyltransferase